MRIEPGDPIDPRSLAYEANRLYGLELFEKVGYRLVHEGDRTGVEFSARAKDWGPNFLKFGASIEDDFEGSTAFNLTTRIRRPEINDLGAEWRTDLQIGTAPLVFSEFYQPLRFDSRVFLAPYIEAGQRNVNAFSADDTVARFRLSEAQLGIDVGSEIGTAGELRVGVFRGLGEARVKVGDPGIANFDFDSGGVFASLRFDTLDTAQFPRRGMRAGVRWNSSRPDFGADNDFDTVEFDLTQVWTRGKSTLTLGLDYATTLESDGALQDFFPLGGFLRLSGLERGQISGPHAGLGRLVYYRSVGGSGGGLLEVPVYVGASLEAGNVWQTRDAISFDSTLTNGSLFVGLDTYVGPIFLAAGFSEAGRTNVYLFIGSTPR